MAEAGKSTLALIALTAMVEQADTAVRAVVDGGVGQIDRSLTARADFLG